MNEHDIDVLYDFWDWGFVSYLFILLAAILFIMIIYFSITAVNNEDRNICYAFLFLVVACVVLAFACVEKVPTYEVLLDNEYTAKEFFDSYIFIEKKGKIYVIKEIEKEEEE